MILPILFAFIIQRVSSQSNAFVCVPAENCITAGGVQPSPGIIDVRIVVPVSFNSIR